LHQPEFRVVDDSEKTGHQKAQPMKGLGLWATLTSEEERETGDRVLSHGQLFNQSCSCNETY
jgi:hypothetical protein